MAEVTLTKDSFESEIKNFEGIALVDFWAEWCGPCRIQGPIIDELAEDLSGDTAVKIAKLNVDDAQEIAQQYGVMSIPTLIVFKNGEPAETLVGVHQKDVLKDKIDAQK